MTFKELIHEFQASRTWGFVIDCARIMMLGGIIAIILIMSMNIEEVKIVNHPIRYYEEVTGAVCECHLPQNYTITYPSTPGSDDWGFMIPEVEEDG